MNDEDIRVVVSGTSWMGSGLGSIESALYQLFSQATDEIIIVAYSVTTAAPLIFSQLNVALQRGIRIRCLINRFHSQTPGVQQRFQDMHKEFPHLLQLFSFVPRSDEADLHAKTIIVDRHYALIGSANLSLRGLTDNHELGVIITGPEVAKITRAVDLLLASPYAKEVY